MLFPKTSASLISSALSTSSDAAVSAITSQPASVFNFGMIFNPEGQPAGQWSYDGFVNHIDTIPAGPSATIIPSGGAPGGIKIRRIPSGSNLANVRVFLF